MPIDKDNPSPLLKLFKTFLSVTLHTLLHHRGLYPPTTFLTVRAFNLSVHQSRHPSVCAWVRSATDAVAAQLSGTFPGNKANNRYNIYGPSPDQPTPTPLARIALLVVHHPRTRAVLERWMLDVQSLPGFWPAEEPEQVNLADATEALRGALRRIVYAADGLEELPERCTFTVAIELQDDAPPPVGHPQEWIPNESNLQPQKAHAFGARSNSSRAPGTDMGGAQTTSIRTVQAGPLFFECWVEEGAAKLAAIGDQMDQDDDIYN